MKNFLFLAVFIFLNITGFAQKYFNEIELPYIDQGHLTYEGIPIYDGGFKVPITGQEIMPHTHSVKHKSITFLNFNLNNNFLLPTMICKSK